MTDLVLHERAPGESAPDPTDAGSVAASTPNPESLIDTFTTAVSFYCFTSLIILSSLFLEADSALREPR